MNHLQRSSPNIERKQHTKSVNAVSLSLRIFADTVKTNPSQITFSNLAFSVHSCDMVMCTITRIKAVALYAKAAIPIKDEAHRVLCAQTACEQV